MVRIAKAKRCPFCASESNFVECMDFDTFAVICNDCGAQGPETEGDACDPDGDSAQGRRTATRAWNQRRRAALSPEAKERVAAYHRRQREREQRASSDFNRHMIDLFNAARKDRP